MAVAELVCLRRARRGWAGRDGLEAIRLSDAIAMGLTQVLALIPGFSRSGTTISAGMIAGLDRHTAARFSFLLSLPAVGAAGLLEAWQARHEILATGDDILAAVAGTFVAGLAGYASIRWLLRLLTSHTLWPFIGYRLILAGLLVWACLPQPVPGGGQPPMIGGTVFPSQQVRPCSATSTTAAAWPGSSPAS